MKKLIALILVVAMVASLVACGNKAAADKAPLEGTMEENVMKVMNELKASGEVKYIGASAYSYHDYGVLAEAVVAFPGHQRSVYDEFDCFHLLTFLFFVKLSFYYEV